MKVYSSYAYGKRTQICRYQWIYSYLQMQSLTHFMPLISSYTYWKYQKTTGFLIFSRGIGKDQWHEMGWPILAQCFISIPSENVRKPLVFWCFQEI